MIVVMKKSNVILIGLIFALLLTIYSLNISKDTDSQIAGLEMLRTVVVDAGHGGEDPGKVSNYSDLKEKDLNLDVAFLLKALLEDDNYRVIMTREEDVLIYEEGTTDIYNKRKQDLTRRKDIMDNSDADIVVSIHMNSFQEEKYYGAQTFYPPSSPESLKLARSIQDAMREVLDKNNKRIPQEKKERIVILTDLKTPTAIVECGFLSNMSEGKKLGSKEYQSKIAMAIKKGIDGYFE